MSNRSKSKFDPEKVTFDMEKIRIAVTKMVDRPQLQSLIERGQIKSFYDQMCDVIVMQFDSYLFGAGKETHEFDVKVPHTWWDHTKMRWFPKWLLRALGPLGKINIDHHQFEADTFKAVCPYFDGDHKAQQEWMFFRASDDWKSQRIADLLDEVHALKLERREAREVAKADA